jgi:hypothetical protein
VSTAPGEPSSPLNLRRTSMKRLQLFAALVCGVSTFLFAATETKADCSWTVAGTLKVQTQQPTLSAKFGPQIALKGVKAKVSGATVGDIFESWGEVTTDSSGKFSITKQKSCGDRKLKIEVRFESNDVEIRDDKLAGVLPNVPWYTIVHDSEKRRKPGLTQILPTVFASSKLHDLDNSIARHHADIWVIANLMREQLATYGPQFKFINKTKIKYPNNEAIAPDGSEASFVHPTTRVVNIFRSNDLTNDHLAKDGGVNVLFHEMTHAWAFERVHGELDLAINLLTSLSTHCSNNEQHVSFHESFADFTRDQLKVEIFGASHRVPFNRDALKEGLSCEGTVDRMTSIAIMEKRELGWMSLFRMLTTPNLKQFKYSGEATSSNEFHSSVFITSGPVIARSNCTDPTNRKLKDILNVFLANPSKGVSSNLDKSEMKSFDAYMRRAAKILGFEAQRNALMNLLDPSKSSEPGEELCGDPIVAPIRPRITPRP